MSNTKNQVYGVVLPAHIAQRARIIAAMQGKSRSKLMRDLLLDYLQRYDSESAAAYPAVPQPVISKRTMRSKKKITKEK